MDIEIKYDTEDWNKKLTQFNAWDLQRDGHHGWDLDDNDELYNVRIDSTWKTRRDLQHEILTWADNNCEGYFYQLTIGSDEGYPVIHPGDMFWIILRFQKKEDAVAFKLRWI